MIECWQVFTLIVSFWLSIRTVLSHFNTFQHDVRFVNTMKTWSDSYNVIIYMHYTHLMCIYTMLMMRMRLEIVKLRNDQTIQLNLISYDSYEGSFRGFSARTWSIDVDTSGFSRGFCLVRHKFVINVAHWTLLEHQRCYWRTPRNMISYELQSLGSPLTHDTAFLTHPL